MFIEAKDAIYWEEKQELEIFIQRLDVQLKLCSWENGLVAYRLEEGEWVEEADIDIPLLDHVLETHKDSPVHDFVNRTIPLNIRERLQPFRHRQYKLLRYGNVFKMSIDLVDSTPWLFFMVICRVIEDGCPDELVEEILQLKQIEILGLLGFPKKKQLIKLLRKLTPSGNGVVGDDLKIVEKVLHCELLLDFLRHRQEIPVRSLQFLYRYRDLIQFSFFDQLYNTAILEESEYSMVAGNIHSTLNDIRRMGRSLEIDDIETRINNFANVEQVHRYHDRLTDRLNRRRREQYEREARVVHQGGLRITTWFPGECKDQSPFPVDPLKGTIWLQYIDNDRWLSKEGDELSHCVASYAYDIKSKKSVIYSMTYPIRATLEIKLNREIPYINQFKAYQNSTPSPSAYLAAETWLQEQIGEPQKKGSSSQIPKTLYFGVGDAGCRIIRNLMRNSDANSEFVFVHFTFNHLHLPRRSLTLPVDKSFLSAGLNLASLRVKRSYKDGFTFLLKSLLNDADTAIIVTGLDNGSLPKASRLIVKTAKRMNIQTTGAITNPYILKGDQIKKLSWFTKTRLKRSFDAILVDTLKLDGHFGQKPFSESTIRKIARRETFRIVAHLHQFVMAQKKLYSKSSGTVQKYGPPIKLKNGIDIKRYKIIGENIDLEKSRILLNTFLRIEFLPRKGQNLHVHFTANEYYQGIDIAKITDEVKSVGDRIHGNVSFEINKSTSKEVEIYLLSDGMTLRRNNFVISSWKQICHYIVNSGSGRINSSA